MINFNPNLPVYEIFTTSGSVFAINFQSEIEAEETYLLDNSIDHYLGIGEVIPIELTEDGEDCNQDAGCPKDRIIRGAKGRFAGCRPAGGGGGGGGGVAASDVEAPKTINSKTNLAQLRAIAKKEGIAAPTKGANKRQTWIDAIEKKAGDKYKGVRGKAGGVATAKTQQAPASDRPVFNAVIGSRKVEKDLESQWIKEHELMSKVIARNSALQEITTYENLLKRAKDSGDARAEQLYGNSLKRFKKDFEELDKETKNNPYKDVKDVQKLSDNYGIGYGVATSLGAEKIAIYDKNGNVQAAAAIQKKGKDAVDDGVEPHVYIDLLATAPWNVINTDKTVKGAGTQTIAEAVKLSDKEGYNGRVRLYPIDEAKPFYEKLGFKEVANTFGDWELSPTDARLLLSKLGTK